MLSVVVLALVDRDKLVWVSRIEPYEAITSREPGRVPQQQALPALELGRTAVHTLQWFGDRLRMGLILHLIAGALAATRPEAAAIIQGAAEANVVQAPMFALASSSTVTGALGDPRATELRARGAEMDWDQAVAYTLTQTTQALNELKSGTQP